MVDSVISHLQQRFHVLFIQIFIYINKFHINNSSSIKAEQESVITHINDFMNIMASQSLFTKEELEYGYTVQDLQYILDVCEG